MIVAFLTRYWPQLGILAALVLGLWYVDHRGYQRAKGHYEAAEAKAQARAEALARRLEQVMTAKLAELDTRTAERLSQIDVEERTIVQPVITREIRNDPRLSNPAAGISNGVRDALNSARGASNNPPAPRQR